MNKLFALALALAFAPALAAQQPGVSFVTDQADAVLAILERRNRGEPAGDSAWAALLLSEGYARLRQREAAMQRSLDDLSFRAFVLSNELARRAPALRATLERWQRVDVAAAAARALAYLPDSTVISAKIYPVIKPATNSFVFEPKTNPAIFLYLNPNISEAQLANTLVHELHHIGLAAACPDLTGMAAYLGTFAEGRAMLAAAGAPGVHPHASSPDSLRALWDRDFAKVRADMARMDTFFTALAEDKVPQEETTQRWMQFVATEAVPQGAYYTVGYLMARTIEEQLGRPRLIASTCDPLMLLTDYNAAVKSSGRSLPVWRDALLKKLRK